MDKQEKKRISNHVRNQPFERSEDYYKKFKMYMWFCVSFSIILAFVFIFGGASILIDKSVSVSDSLGYIFVVFGSLSVPVCIYNVYIIKQVIPIFGEIIDFDKRWYLISAYALTLNILGVMFMMICIAYRGMYNTRILFDKQTWNFEHYQKEKYRINK